MLYESCQIRNVLNADFAQLMVLVLHGERVLLCQVCGSQSTESGRFDCAELSRVALVWQAACTALGWPEKARRFLETTHPLLNQSIPIELAWESESGADRVLALLGRIQYSIPV